MSDSSDAGRQPLSGAASEADLYEALGEGDLQRIQALIEAAPTYITNGKAGTTH